MAKLILNKETLRSLNNVESEQVDGAWLVPTVTCNYVCQPTLLAVCGLTFSKRVTLCAKGCTF